MNCLIIGAAFNYSPEAVRPLLLSIKVLNEDIDVLLFRERDDPEWTDAVRMIYERVTVVCPQNASAYRATVWATFRLRWLCRAFLKIVSILWSKLPFLRPVCEGIAPYFMHIMSKRFMDSLRVLKCTEQVYDIVMLTDVRDVILQRPPQLVENEELITGEEPVTFRESEINQKWMQSFFPEEADLVNWVDRKVLCAGVSYGSRQGIIHYLETMRDAFMSHLERSLWVLGPDQAIHNHILREGPQTNMLPSTISDGMIATLSCRTPEGYEFSDELGLVTSDGRQIAIVHQYDRYPLIQERILARLERLHQCNAESGLASDSLDVLAPQV